MDCTWILQRQDERKAENASLIIIIMNNFKGLYSIKKKVYSNAINL